MGFEITTRLPKECEKRELDTFDNLVREGGEVNPIGLRRRVENAVMLSWILTPEEDMIGVAALKRPNKNYHKSVFEKSRSELERENWPIELGWIYVRSEYRKQGLAGRLLKQLMTTVSGGVFATARQDNESIQSHLKRHGFSPRGESFPSRDGDYKLVLYVKDA